MLAVVDSKMSKALVPVVDGKRWGLSLQALHGIIAVEAAIRAGRGGASVAVPCSGLPGLRRHTELMLKHTATASLSVELPQTQDGRTARVEAHNRSTAFVPTTPHSQGPRTCPTSAGGRCHTAPPGSPPARMASQR